MFQFIQMFNSINLVYILLEQKIVIIYIPLQINQ